MRDGFRAFPPIAWILHDFKFSLYSIVFWVALVPCPHEYVPGASAVLLVGVYFSFMSVPQKK